MGGDHQGVLAREEKTWTEETNLGSASAHCHTQRSAVVACCGRSDTHSLTNPVYTKLICSTNMFLLHSGRSRARGVCCRNRIPHGCGLGDEVEEEDSENTSPI